jgi:hypothetical protein
MASFGAMPFDLDAEGKVAFGEPRQVTSEIGARCLAAAMAATNAGAIAFAHSGDLSSNEPAAPVILARFDNAGPVEVSAQEAA